jgi:hypothetical protein
MRSAVALVAAGLLANGCIPSNVVAEQDRAVALPAAALAWDEPVPTALAGLYESVAITGDAAQAMVKVYYWFDGGGAFTGAALVREGAEPRFQTLSGRYRIAEGRIWLGEDTEPATLAAAKDHLRLASADGNVVLRRVGD